LAVHDFQYAILRFREVHDRNWNVQKKRFDESAGLALVPHVLALVTEFEKQSFGVDVLNQCSDRKVVGLRHKPTFIGRDIERFRALPLLLFQL
jgi:hypothetical protein